MGRKDEVALNSSSSSTQTKARNWRRSDFEIHSLLGEGALSRVYLAYNIFTQQQVALKVIPKHRVATGSILQSILQERKALSVLDAHPNFIWLICSFQDELYLYFELELVSGGSLAEVLSRYNHRIAQTLVFYWACDMINILIHLRAKRIAHRDIKPDNILLDEHRRLRLIDFNNAIFVTDSTSCFSRPRKLNESNSSSSSQENSAKPHSHRTNEVFGALHYLPPEVMLRMAPKLFVGDPEFERLYAIWRESNPEVVRLLEQSVSAYAIDIWSSGCVLFEVFCGYHPFKGTSDIQTVFNVLNYNMTAPPAFFGDGASDLVNRLLHQDPTQRLGAQDVDELRRHQLFAYIDLNSIPHCTLRPPFQEPPVSVGAENGTTESVTEEFFEFTPDLGNSFRGVAAEWQAENAGPDYHDGTLSP